MKNVSDLLLLVCLLLGMNAGATEVEYRRPSNGEGLYQESNIDLRVKVLGGEILLRREVKGLKWEFNRAWADLGMSDRGSVNRYLPISLVQSKVSTEETISVLDRSSSWLPKQLYRNGYVYQLQTSSQPSLWRGEEGRYIVATESGLRWQDRSGEWVEYDGFGRMTRFGNISGVLASVTRDANQRIEKVFDRKQQLAMTLGYDAAGRLMSVEDRASRVIRYQWDSDKLVKVVDALGGEWGYQYDVINIPYFMSWPRLSYGGFYSQHAFSYPRLGNESFVVIKQITDPEARVTKLENLVHGGTVTWECRTQGGETSWRIVEKQDPDTGNWVVTREPVTQSGRVICSYYTTPYQVVLKAITDSDNQRTEFGTAYDSAQEIYSSRRQNADGSQIEKILGTDGRPQTVYRGGELVYSRVKEGQREVMVDSAGNRTETFFDEWDNPTRITYADNSSRSFTWHGRFNFPLTMTDENGVVTEFRYNNDGQLTDKIEARGLPEQRASHYQYNADGLVETMELTGAGGVNYQQSYEYDEYGNVRRETTNNQVSRQFVDYTVTGQPQIMIDERQQEWRYSYNAEGQLLTQTDPLQHMQKYAFDKLSNMISYQDATAKLWSFAYDGQNRLKSVTNPHLQSQGYRYNSEGMLIEEKDAQGHSKTLVYDKAGRLQKQLDGVGNSTRYQFGYDSANRNGGFNLLRSLTTPSYQQSYRYNNRNRLVATSKTVAGQELTDEFDYDKLGQLTSSRDANGRETKLEYDAFGNITLADSEGAISKAQYDALGNLLEFTDPVGGRWIFSYDSFGRKKSLTRPGFGQWSYDYTPTGKLASLVDAKGQQQSFEYDAAGRMTARRFFANSEQAKAVEKALKTISYGYDANDRLTSWDDGEAKGSLAYDDAGRFLGEALNYGTFSRGYRYGYYANGLKKSLTTNDGTVIGYEYDAGNKLTKVTLPGVGSVSINEYNWLAPTQIQYPGGVQKRIEYTELLEPKHVGVSDLNGKSVANLAWEYGRAREITGLDRDGLKSAYDYNERYALTSAKESQQDKSGNTTQGREFSYQLDANANRIAENGDSDWQYQDGKLIKAKGHSYEYDANGNQIKESYSLFGVNKVREFGYDGDNRLLWVKDNGALLARYSYDPFGRRLSKEINGKITYFIYSTEGLLAELDSDGNEQVGYGFRPQGIWGTDPLYLRAAGKYYYYQNDHLGTPYRIVDGTGFIVWSAQQDPFGQMAVAPGSTLTNNLRFPGQYYDSEIKLHYNLQRYYQPFTGQYIGSDPIGLSGGENSYSYVNGSPIDYFDQFGLKEFPDSFVGPLPPGGYYTSEMTQTSCGRVPPAPPSVDIDKNILLAKESYDPYWYYNQVRWKHPWDYKQQGRKYEDFGNFNYGATGKAFGFPSTVLYRMAGWANQKADKTRTELGEPLGDYPYGDDPADQEQIKKGIEYCECIELPEI